MEIPQSRRTSRFQVKDGDELLSEHNEFDKAQNSAGKYCALRNKPIQIIGANYTVSMELFEGIPTSGETSNYTGTFSDGNSVVIHAQTGQNFGNGPTVLLYDDISGSGTVGTDIPYNSPSIGQYDSGFTGRNGPPHYHAEAFHGDRSMVIHEYGTTNGELQHRVAVNNVTEIFISYWLKLAAGSAFPGNGYSTAQTFPSQSVWKLLWIGNEERTGSLDTTNDYVIPTIPGTQFTIGGNNCPNAAWLDSTTNTWWDWDGWMRVSWHGKAGTTPTSTDGFWDFKAVSSQEHFDQHSDGAMFNDWGGLYQRWTGLTLCGWMSHNDPARPCEGAAPLHDLIYIAEGANANARVEIGDSATYSSCTRLVICPSTSWTATDITITVCDGDYSSLVGKTVYITKSDNTRYQFTI